MATREPRARTWLLLAGTFLPKSVLEMDTISAELVCCVLERAAVLTSRCVNSRWRDLASVVRPRLKQTARPMRDHMCTLNAMCALRYAQKMADLGRRNLYGRMNDCVNDGPSEAAKLH